MKDMGVCFSFSTILNKLSKTFESLFVRGSDVIFIRSYNLLLQRNYYCLPMQIQSATRQ